MAEANVRATGSGNPELARRARGNLEPRDG